MYIYCVDYIEPGELSRYSDGLWAGRPGDDFFLLHSVQTDSEAHPTSHPMGTGGFFHGNKAAVEWNWLLTFI
jgi:hypothetical protein